MRYRGLSLANYGKGSGLVIDNDISGDYTLCYVEFLDAS